jgi:hypothetical protein
MTDRPKHELLLLTYPTLSPLIALLLGQSLSGGDAEGCGYPVLRLSRERSAGGVIDRDKRYTHRESSEGRSATTPFGHMSGISLLLRVSGPLWGLWVDT